MGIEIGPDGKIWYVNTTQNKVNRLDFTPFTVPTSEPGNGVAFSVSPNPTDQAFEVRVATGNMAASYRLRVLNALGQLVLEEPLSGRTTVQVDLSGQSAGYYFVQAGVDTRIRFCLAKLDPQGRCTDGIVRLKTILTNHQPVNRATLITPATWGRIPVIMTSPICRTRCAITWIIRRTIVKICLPKVKRTA